MNSPPAAFVEHRIETLAPTFVAFGVAIDFLARISPFSDRPVGEFVPAVRRQVVRSEHVAMLRGDEMVGYLGWLPTSQAIAAGWVAGSAPLTPCEGAGADAVALTVVATTGGRPVAPLIRAARDLNPGRRVFFQRSYPGGARASRRAAVLNRGSGRS